MLQAMSLFVTMTALYSIYVGVRANIRVYRAINLPPPQAMTASVFGCMAVFIGVLLILCARDLYNRGSIVMWEGVLRLVKPAASRLAKLFEPGSSTSDTYLRPFNGRTRRPQNAGGTLLWTLSYGRQGDFRSRQ